MEPVAYLERASALIRESFKAAISADRTRSDTEIEAAGRSAAQTLRERLARLEPPPELKSIHDRLIAGWKMQDSENSSFSRRAVARARAHERALAELYEQCVVAGVRPPLPWPPEVLFRRAGSLIVIPQEDPES
jgi:hypothetical protein